MNAADWDDDQLDDLGDDEWGYGDHGDESAESETVPCPACGTDVYEEAEQCPACGEYIVHDTRVWSGKPIWWILLGLAGIIAVILTFLPWLV